MLTPESIVLVVGVFLLAGWVKGVVGMGLPTVAMGALGLVMAPVQAAALLVVPSRVSKHRFGTATADFYVCARCGVVPFVTSAIDGDLYAVVNVNTFEGIDSARLVRTATTFDGEGAGERLERRKRNWIRRVRISGA